MMKLGLLGGLGIVAFGVFIGALSGLLGIGSGVIMVPVLGALWAANPDAQKIAQGTALAVMVPMSIASALSYHFGGQQDSLRLSIPLALWALAMALLAFHLPLRWPHLLTTAEPLGLVNWGFVVFLSIGAVIGTMYFGAPLAAALPGPLLKKIFGLIIVLVGLRMVGFYELIGSLFSGRSG